MNKKFRAFLVTLGLAFLVLLGPRHPEANPQFSFDFGYLRSVDSDGGIARNEVVLTGKKVWLHNWGKGGCGDNLPIEGQLNCLIYKLNHPEEWLGR